MFWKTLTSHWFLIVLADVDQVPQAWIELVHHSLGGKQQQKQVMQFVIMSNWFIILGGFGSKHTWVNIWATVYMTEGHRMGVTSP